MRKPKYRVDTFDPATDQMRFEDRLDEFGEQDWEVVAAFVMNGWLWVISRRTWWWRFWN